MSGGVRAFLAPRWLARHALLLLVLYVLTRIGVWQWDKARAQEDWQNYGYAVQWWLFAAFAVFLWVKAVLDELDPARVQVPDEPAPVVTAPAPVADVEDDEELAEYNRHLARLAEQARE